MGVLFIFLEKKDGNKMWLKVEAATAAEPPSSKRRLDAPQDDSGDDEDGWEELRREQRMAKQVKEAHLSSMPSPQT
ncbi:hypothetical protein NUW54_g8209 [Trametes sanguinea]|uniref:Uncharacterized protein n=1 Tax=Trametes sanguinea TaxID=158606 RepID=A0ACC1PHT6_9APHY|nr:hypothetical protein NUW54_g8209 [Trametes sanguinea]